MRSFAIVLLLATLGAAGASKSVTVQPSSLGFKQALSSCPSGTLGSITLTLGHVRVAEGAGVDSDIDDANPSNQQIVLTNGNSRAMVAVDATKNVVSAKHVTLEAAKRVACIAPD